MPAVLGAVGGQDLPPVTGKSWDMVAQELIVEAEGARSAAGGADAAGTACPQRPGTSWRSPRLAPGAPSG